MLLCFLGDFTLLESLLPKLFVMFPRLIVKRGLIEVEEEEDEVAEFVGL